MAENKVAEKKFLKGALWFLAFVLTTVVAIAAAIYLLMWLFCKGPSVSARNTFVATMLETGNMKFVVSWYLTEEEILSITESGADSNYFSDIDLTSAFVSTDHSGESEAASASVITGETASNITIHSAVDNISDVGLISITGRTFEAQLLVVRDPSRITLATAYPWSSMEREKNGMTVGEYCIAYGGLAAVNAGEFETPSGINWGGRPIGIVVCDGEVLFNEPTAGDVLVGFNKNNILVIEEVGSMTPEQFESYVYEHAIINAVSFKDISDGNTNHFTRLITDGTAVNLNGKGIGANPRTAIGQCADGTVLILVTDGRGSAGHLGATGQDLINILMEYGAVNAANLDGGSSSSLFYDGEYMITSSFLPNSDASRRLPTVFVVTGPES